VEKWMLYFDEHPPLRDHLNLCLAQVSAIFANSRRDARKKPIPIKEFIINYKQPEREKLSRKQVADKVRMLLV
jgi:hypothetical protein